jgi:hypothetical protein
VAKKEYAAAGIPVAKKGKALEPLATYEVTPEKATSPTVVTFYPANASGAAAMVAVEVTGRSEAMLVDKGVLDDLKSLAARLRASSLGVPTPTSVPGAPTAAPAAPTAAAPAAPVRAPTPAAPRRESKVKS